MCCFTSTILSSDISSWDCYKFEGAKIIGEDGTFLGSLESGYNSDSIYNSYGDYGSSYCTDCIWNEYSDWGNTYSSTSPFNEDASDPPVLLKDGEIVGLFTTKEYISDGINPDSVGRICGWD